MQTGTTRLSTFMPTANSRPIGLRSDGSAAAGFKVDIDNLFADGKIDDYLSGDRERTARAHHALIYCFHKLSSAKSRVDLCLSCGLYQDPRMAAVLKHLIEGFVGTTDRTILLHKARRLRTRAHPDKTGPLLNGIAVEQKAIVAKRIWEFYSSILEVVNNKEVLDALYGAASRAHDQDTYEHATSGALGILPASLRRWLWQPRRYALAPWKELAIACAAVVVGVAVGAAVQMLQANPGVACLAGAAAGVAAYLALRQFLAKPSPVLRHNSTA